MEEKLKELLLKDLCARLPYNVQTLADLDKEFDGGVISKLVGIVPYTGKKYDIQGPLFYQDGCLTPFTIEEIRPYLRTMSSMTDEEKVEIQDLYHKNTKEVFKDPSKIRGYRFYDISVVDWLNAHHFDYRGLIEKGLALKAPEGIYNIK